MKICIPHAVLKLKRNVPWISHVIADGMKQEHSLQTFWFNPKRNEVTILRNSKQSFDRLAQVQNCFGNL